MSAILETSSPDESDRSIKRPRPLVLLLLDGWGIAPSGEGNAISLASTPTITELIKEYPVATLDVPIGDWNKRYLSLGSGTSLDSEDASPLVNLAGVLSQAGLRQIKITDADRFAALTYFFNGLNEGKNVGEDWQIISTTTGREDKATADFKAVLKAGLRATKEDDPADFIVISFSYLDAVVAAAANRIDVVIKAVEAIDKGIRLIVNSTIGQGGVVIISSAGGNAEQMINLRTEENDSSLTNNSVPLIVVGEDYKGLSISGQDAPDQDLSILKPVGTLVDIAPTILSLLDLEKPSQMTGRNLAE